MSESTGATSFAGQRSRCSSLGTLALVSAALATTPSTSCRILLSSAGGMICDTTSLPPTPAQSILPLTPTSFPLRADWPDTTDVSDGFELVVRDSGSCIAMNDIAVIPLLLSATSLERFPSAAGGSSLGTSFGYMRGERSPAGGSFELIVFERDLETFADEMGEVGLGEESPVGAVGAVDGRLGRIKRECSLFGKKEDVLRGVIAGTGGRGRRWMGSEVGLRCELGGFGQAQSTHDIAWPSPATSVSSSSGALGPLSFFLRLMLNPADDRFFSTLSPTGTAGGLDA